MKLRCVDKVVRKFMVRIDPITKHRHQIQCVRCGETFGYGQISKIKHVLRIHTCICDHWRWVTHGYDTLRCIDCQEVFKPRTLIERSALQIADFNQNKHNRAGEIMAGDIDSGMVFD